MYTARYFMYNSSPAPAPSPSPSPAPAPSPSPAPSPAPASSGEWQVGSGFRLNLASLLGIQSDAYYWQVRTKPTDGAVDSSAPAEMGTVYQGKPLRIMDAVAVLFKFMNDLDAGNILNLKEELINEDSKLRVDIGQKDAGTPNPTTGEVVYTTHYFDQTMVNGSGDVVPTGGSAIWANKIYKWAGLINNEWIQLNRNPWTAASSTNAYTIAQALTDLRTRVDLIGLELSTGATAGVVKQWHSTFANVPHFNVASNQYANQVTLARVLGIDNANYTTYVKSTRDATGAKQDFATAPVLTVFEALVDHSRRLNDLEDGDALDLKEELDRVREQLGLDTSAVNTTDYKNGTVWNAALQASFTTPTVSKIIGLDSPDWVQFNRQITYNTTTGDINRANIAVGGATENLSVDTGSVLNVSDSLVQLNQRPRTKLIDLGLINAWDQVLGAENLAIDPYVSLEARFFGRINANYTDGALDSLETASNASVVDALKYLVRNGIPTKTEWNSKNLFNTTHYREALQRLTRISYNNYSLTLRTGYAHSITFRLGVDFGNAFHQNLPSQFFIDYKDDQGNWHVGKEAIESIVLDDVQKVELNAIVDLRNLQQTIQTGLDKTYTFCLRAVCADPMQSLPVAEDPMFNARVARVLHFIDRYAGGMVPEQIKADPIVGAALSADDATYSYIKAGDKKVTVGIWASPFLSEFGSNQKDGHEFAKTSAPTLFKGTIPAPSNEIASATYEVDCLTSFTTFNMLKMFYDGTEGEYPAGFANGYVDVPLSLYATTQSNYFDNEKQQYKYVDGGVTHWVFARVYALTSLSANNGGEMMYEYDRRLLANRIVGLNKRVFAHHEELDAYVDLSDSRAFFHGI